TYRLTDRLDVQAGLRQSYTRSSFYNDAAGPYFGTPEPQIRQGKQSGDALTYLLTPRFKLSPDVMVYARFASGFRPGGANSVPTAIDSGVPSTFSTDHTNNYEVGLKGDFLDRHLSLDASVYHIEWKNIQLQLAVNAWGYIANGGSAKSDGVEFSFN